MKKTSGYWLFGLLSICVAASGLAQNGDILNLDELIAGALKSNPSLQAARLQTAAARTQVRQVRAWDPPQVGIEFYQTPIQAFPNPVSEGMETDYFVQQMIPFPGKISNMAKAARNNVEMSAENYNALERRVIRDLKSAYYELYLVQRKIAINAENQALLRQFVDIAMKQYEVGMGKQVDIFRAQTELSSLITEGINLEQQQKVSEAMINTILNHPVNSPLGYVPDLADTTATWTYDQIMPLALKVRPELKAMDYNINMNRAELALAKREYVPDLMVRFMYKDMANTGDDFWALMGGVSVPLAFWSKGKFKGKVQENQLNVKRAEEEYTEVKNMILFEVQRALVKVQSNKNVLTLYESTVVPQAEQTMQSTLAAYQTGKTEFLMLIDAYRMLLMAKLDYHMAVMNYMTSQAQLEQAVGMDIKELSARIFEE
ncbi:MAG TPA: TolC family protein [bacterium]